MYLQNCQWGKKRHKKRRKLGIFMPPGGTILLLIAFCVTHWANLVRFCCVFISLILWLSFFCVLICLLLQIYVVTTTHPHYSSYFKCTICCKLPSHVKRWDNLCINYYFIDSALRGRIKYCSYSQRSYGQHHFKSRTPSATKKVVFFRIIIICISLVCCCI